MTKEQVSAIVSAQRAYFDTHATLPVEFRINALRALKFKLEIARAKQEQL